MRPFLLASLILCIHCQSLFAITLVPTLPLTISTPGNNASMQVAMSPTGDGLAIWQKTSTTQLETAFFDGVTKTWRNIALIGVNGLIQTGGSPQVGMDKNGNGIAIWVNQTQIQAARFNRATLTWSLFPFFLSVNGTNTYPRLAVNLNGQAFAAWLNFLSSQQIQGALFDGISTWSAPVQLSVQPALPPPAISIDGNGNGLVLWSDTNSNGTIKAEYVIRN